MVLITYKQGQEQNGMSTRVGILMRISGMNCLTDFFNKNEMEKRSPVVKRSV